ncbi:MAG: hypothetical protein NC301_03470 [Bacteroides sp.]|nr:hypothetical protein [Bacteroides sp.]MCM1379194.1 hypothetical protein [Bacteroides sp.]MCM1445157.1 hypothetical protein [Prevotella sp.]
MKKLLLAICAGLALSASAQTYKLGEAFAYDFNTFAWFDNDPAIWENNSQWPATEMLDGASLEEGWGLGMIHFHGDAFTANCTTLEACNKQFPIVKSLWTENAMAAKIQVTATGWWAYGNANFALPAMEELSRIRVVYRVDIEGWSRFEPENKKPFHVRLTDSDQDGCFAEPKFEEAIPEFWDNPGFRTVDMYYQPNGQTYLALTFDGAGITVDNQRPALYIQEVSVVPVSKLAGDDHKSGDCVPVISENAPVPVVISNDGGDDAISEITAAAKVAEGIYDLQGRKLAAPVKGLNIINGVKTLVK